MKRWCLCFLLLLYATFAEGFILRRLRAPLIFGWRDENRQFLIQARALLQENPDLDEVFQIFKQLQKISQKSDFPLRLSFNIKQEINELFREADAVLSQYEDYLSQNFEKFFRDMDVPFPRKYLKAIWRGQLEFAADLQELRKQLEQGFTWIKRFREGLLTQKVYKWKQVPLSSLRMLIDLALEEKGKKFLSRESFLRTKFEIYGGRSLTGFMPLFGEFHQLLLKLKLYPKNYPDWKDYIVEAKKNGAGIEPRIISEGVMSLFAQRQFLEDGARELGEELYEYVNRRNFFKRYDFLSGGTLSFILHGYESLEELRRKLEIPPQDLSGWQQLLDRDIRIRWDEVDDEIKLELILSRINKAPWELIPHDFVKAGLFGLLDHYGDIKTLTEKLIIPQLTIPQLIAPQSFFSQDEKLQQVVEEFLNRDLSWEKLAPVTVKLAQGYLLLRACSSLNMRVSEFISEPDNFSLPIPAFNGKTLNSLLSYWGSIPAIIEGLGLKNILETQWESNSYPAYATYWSLILIVKVAQDLGYLESAIDLDHLQELAWMASFGYKQLEEVLDTFSSLGREVFQSGKMLPRVFPKILVYLSQNNILRINGKQFQILEEEFGKRFPNLREILMAEKANEDLLPAQLEKVWQSL